MRNEIYNRNPEDPNYMDGQLTMDDPLEMFKQQIENCLFTTKTMVMGTTDFGASLEDYVWTFRTSEDALANVVNLQIQNYCTMAKYFTYSVNVKFYHGTVRDICHIDVNINQTDNFSVLMG